MRKHSEVFYSRNRMSDVENSGEQKTIILELKAMVNMIFVVKFFALFHDFNWFDSWFCISHK